MPILTYLQNAGKNTVNLPAQHMSTTQILSPQKSTVLDSNYILSGNCILIINNGGGIITCQYNKNYRIIGLHKHSKCISPQHLSLDS